MKPSDSNLGNIPGLSHSGAEPYFHEPWQAKLFALTLSLQSRGLFGWPDWTSRLARHLRMVTELPSNMTTPAHAEHYYTVWLQTLEEILREAGVADAIQINEVAKQWKRAAQATPHGKPILYENGLNTPGH